MAPRLKIAEGIARDIEQWVVDQGWPVGVNLGSEQDLITRYGVSRSVLREAIRIVEHHGVAGMRPGPLGGLIVTAPQVDAVERAASLYLDWAQVSTPDLLGIRTTLELACVDIVAAQIDEPTIHKLRAHVAHEVDGAWDEPQIDGLNDLHVMIAGLTGNPAMRLFVQTLVRLTMDHAHTETLGHQVFEDIHTAHVRIVEALTLGDPALARERMRKHLRASVHGAREAEIAAQRRQERRPAV